MRVKILTLFSLLLITGCATQPAQYTVRPTATGVAGIYHEIKAGETLWSISRAYRIDIDKLAKINHIPASSEISAGQLIFIPGAKETIEVTAVSEQLQDFSWPVKGKVIGYFGSLVDNVVNKGIDILADSNQPVLASGNGTVAFIGKSLAGFGDTVIVEHQHNISTVYCNLNEVSIKIGAEVKKKDKLASLKKGDTMHFEVRKGAKPENPLFYLNANSR